MIQLNSVLHYQKVYCNKLCNSQGNSVCECGEFINSVVKFEANKSQMRTQRKLQCKISQGPICNVTRNPPQMRTWLSAGDMVDHSN